MPPANAVSRSLMRRSLTPFRGEMVVASCCCCFAAAFRRRMPKRTAACGINWRKAATKPVGKARDYRLRPYRTQLGSWRNPSRHARVFYDIESKLPLGNATQVQHLSDPLNMERRGKPARAGKCVHKNMSWRRRAGADEAGGSLLINAARGTVVDISCTSQALAEAYLAGAAIDVFPTEPGHQQRSVHPPLMRGLTT